MSAMAPKKKGKKSSEPQLSGPEAQAEMERKLLIEEAKALKKRKELEELQFNEFQQEKEKLNYFWIVEKKKLEDKRAELRNKEREMQDLEEKHQVEIKVYKQRVKHLLYEHQDERTRQKLGAQVSLKIAQADSRTSEADLTSDKRLLKVELKEMQLAHDDFMTALKTEQDKAITLKRFEFERECKELHNQYEERMKNLRAHLEAQRAADIQVIEERKARHVAALMKSHDAAFQEIKNYYNEITHSNLDLIHSLKEELHELKRKEATDDRLMFDIAQENKRMTEPLKRALADVERLTEEREVYRKEMATLQKVKAKLVVGEQRLRDMQWEHEVLEQRYTRLQAERDDLKEKFQDALYDVQQKAGFKALLLRKKLDAAHTELEKKEAHLTEILASANLEPSVMGVLAKRLDEVVESKDSAIRELQSELQRVIAAHNRLISGYERKLGEFGIPPEELGFVPLRSA